MNLKNPERLLLAFLLFVISPQLWALDSDRQQPLKIVADKAVLDDKNGTAMYTGNVVLTQGTLKINAEKLRLTTVDGKVEKVTAEGNPANFSQVPAPNQAAVVATALNIDYLVKEQTLILKRKASIVQNENVFKGEEIVYEIQSQRLQAMGQSSATPKGEKGTGRVEMILPSAAEIAPQVAPGAKAKVQDAKAKAEDQIKQDGKDKPAQ